MKSKITTIKKLLFLVVFVLQSFTLIFGQNKPDDPVSISFNDNGDLLQGWFYKATGDGPFSTAILLQGSVGQDGDFFHLGENLAKNGFNAMTYSYPGAWRSEGLRTDKDALNSVQTAINFLMSKSTIESFEIDTTNIILIGYSYGGGMALLGSALNGRVKKVISIAGGDLSIRAKELEESPEFRQNFEEMIDNFLSNPIMVRGSSGKEYVESMITNKHKFDVKKYAPELAKKDVLLIVGSSDNLVNTETHVMPLYRDLLSHRDGNVSITTFETDHQFTNVQKELNEVIIKWLKKDE